MSAEEDEEGRKAEEDRDGETPRGAPVEVIRVGGGVTPPEENADLPGFAPGRTYMLLQGVYGYFPHHNDGLHLHGGIKYNALWHRCWRRITAQSAIWYATPSGAVGRRFTEIWVAEWQVFLGRSWNSERPLDFAHVFLTKMSGVRRDQEIRALLTQ